MCTYIQISCYLKILISLFFFFKFRGRPLNTLLRTLMGSISSIYRFRFVFPFFLLLHFDLKQRSHIDRIAKRRISLREARLKKSNDVFFFPRIPSFSSVDFFSLVCHSGGCYLFIFFVSFLLSGKEYFRSILKFIYVLYKYFRRLIAVGLRRFVYSSSTTTPLIDLKKKSNNNTNNKKRLLFQNAKADK